MENQPFKLCDITTEGPQGKPNKVISSCYARKYEIMASSSLVSPEIGKETFLKAQIAVSEVLGRHRFNKAVFFTPVVDTKRELRAAIFETGERPIFWHLDKKIDQHANTFFANNTPNVTLLSQKSRDFATFV